LIQKKIYSGDNSLIISKNQERSLDFFWYGFIVYMLFYIFSATEGFALSPASCQGVQAIGFILMAYGASGLISVKFDDQYLGAVFWIYLAYSMTIVARGAELSMSSLKQLLFDITFGAMPYLAPLVVLLPRNIKAYKKIFKVLLTFGVCFLVLVALFINVMRDPDRLNLQSQGLVENFSGLLAVPGGFLLMTYLYHSKEKDFLQLGRKNLFAGFVLIVALYFAIFRARRGLIFICGTTLASIGMVYLISAKRKMLIIITLVIFVGFVALFMAGRKTPAMFNFLVDRGEEDTRSGVEVYMYADMSSTDWVIGKGLKGEYYCPIVDNVNDASGFRGYIETGYLQMILKGGIMSIVLLLLILIPAIFKGLFKSKNILSKAAAIWITLWIIYEYPVIGVGFTMHYVLVWISVGICYSKKIRNMADSTIKFYLQK
jgi:hypothetical protein